MQQEAAGAGMAIRVAAAIEVLVAAGFGVGAIWTLLYLQDNGHLPLTPWGFRSMAGPFEALGQEGFTLLGTALVGVCALDVLAGMWLWQRRTRGLVLGLLTAPVAFGLGLGFALPFLLASIPIRVVLALAGRRTVDRP
jgi:hypothetical protein